MGTEKGAGKEIEIGGLHLSSDDKFRFYEDKTLMENTLMVSSNLIRDGLEHIEENWALIMNLGVCRRVAEEVSELVYEDYIDITIEPFLSRDLALYAYMRDGRRIRLGDLGEGVQNYVVARILYEVEKPGVLLWDDVESHLNPRMLLGVAGWLSNLVDKGTQVVLTTHSLEAARVIAGMNEKMKIYLTSLEDGVLRVKDMKLNDVEELLNAGIDVRVGEAIL